MSCVECEADLALYAGGDLPPGRTAEMELHLETCAECRAVVAELHARQAMLHELRDIPLEEAELEDAMLARVRRGVLAQVSQAERRRASWDPRSYWKLALAAALVLAAVLWLPFRTVKQPRAHRTAPPSPVAPEQSVPSPALMVPVRHRVVRPHHRAPVHLARNSAAPPAHTGSPLLVQFVTEDPNIVIYWLVDQKPQGD